MLRIIFILINLLLITLFFSACEQENIVDPVPDNTTLKKGAVVQSATGSGHFILSEELRVFTHNARIKADGAVSGHFDLIRHDIGSHVGGLVICLNIQGDVAYFAGVVEVSNLDNDPNFGVGSYVIWSTIDNGKGANYPPDQVSLLLGNYNWTQTDVEDFCDSGPGFVYGYHDVEDGNIQIH